MYISKVIGIFPCKTSDDFDRNCECSKKNLSKISFNIYNSTYYNFNKSPLTLLASRRTGTDSNESLIITRVELIEVQFLTAFPHVTFLVNNLKHWLTIGLWMNPFGQVIIFVS